MQAYLYTVSKGKESITTRHVVETSITNTSRKYIADDEGALLISAVMGKYHADWFQQCIPEAIYTRFADYRARLEMDELISDANCFRDWNRDLGAHNVHDA